MTRTSAADSQVLVVGAGPTGLVLASQLLARGIDTRVIDRAAAPCEHSRAVGIHARTLELLDRMRLADDFVASGHQVRHLRLYAGRKNILDLGPARTGSPFDFTLHLPQSRTEALLLEHLRGLGGRVERGVELVRLAQNGSAVDVTLRDASGRQVEITSNYVVGCDGAHSRVRHQLDLPFVGQPYAQDWLVADVALDGAGSDNAVHLYFRPDGLPLSCIPMGGPRWRIVLANAGDRGRRPPTFDEIQALVAQRAPRRITVTDPEWMSCFRCQLRVTTSYRRGRVLLAGDAAHVHSPAGGQGMNTGMSDAENLAWKLALVADGRTSDALLDTYEQERRPIASGVLRFTDRMVGLMTMRSPVKRALRDTLLPAAGALPSVQRRISGRLSQTSIAYAPGPVVRPDELGHGPQPGHRCPDLEVRTEFGRARLYEVLRSGRHVLLVSNRTQSAVRTSSGVDGHASSVLDGVMSSGLDGVAGLTEVVEAQLPVAYTLVRPDGVVAVRGARDECHRIVTYLRALQGDAPADRPPGGAPSGGRTAPRTRVSASV